MDKYTQRADLLKQMRAFSDAHPTMSDEQVKEYEGIEASYDAIDARIKQDEALQAREDSMTKPTSTPIVSDPAAAVIETDDYVAGFDAYLAGRSMGEYRAVMTEGVDAEGGYIVPESYQKKVIEKLNTMGRTRSISNVIGTESTLNIPVEGDAPTFTWIDEGTAYGLTDSTFGTAVLNAWKLGGIIKVSEELLQDNMIDFDTYMAGQIAKGIDKGEAAAFAVGDGVKKPTGYATTAPVGTSSTTAAVAAVTADEIIDIYYDLLEEYRDGATWRMTDKTEKAIRKLKNSEGDYIYSPAMSEGERPTLLGVPIVIDNNMAELGTGNKFIVIGNFDYYQIGDRGGMSIQRLNEKYADEGFVGIKVYKRVDGKVTLAEAFNAGQNA